MFSSPMHTFMKNNEHPKTCNMHYHFDSSTILNPILNFIFKNVFTLIHYINFLIYLVHAQGHDPN